MMWRSKVCRTLAGAVGVSVALAACGDTVQPKPEPEKPLAAETVSATAAAPPEVVALPAPTSKTTELADESDVAATASAAPRDAASGSPKVATTGAPTATAAASAGPDVKGAEAKGPSFTAYMSASSGYKAGKPGTVTAVVNALGDYKVNPEYPFKVKLDGPPAGISFPETTVRNVNRSEKKATISIPFTPEKAGTATISGTCSLSVCRATECVIDKVPVSVTVKVE
jgi:hypothetical protein